MWVRPEAKSRLPLSALQAHTLTLLLVVFLRCWEERIAPADTNHIWITIPAATLALRPALAFVCGPKESKNNIRWNNRPMRRNQWPAPQRARPSPCLLPKKRKKKRCGKSTNAVRHQDGKGMEWALLPFKPCCLWRWKKKRPSLPLALLQPLALGTLPLARIQ